MKSLKSFFKNYYFEEVLTPKLPSKLPFSSENENNKKESLGNYLIKLVLEESGRQD